MMPEEKAIARKIVPRKALKKLERKIKPDENRMIRTIERPKKFKKDESGIINYSWPTKKLGDLFDIQLGKMLNESARKGELFPYLANFNVRWGSFDFSRLNKMSFSENERRKFSLRTGDLLMCEGGEIGRCAVWTSEDISIFYQKALHRLRPLNQNITSEFIYYYMQHIATKNELPKLVGETSIAHLTKEKLVCLLVPFPPLSEQKAITTLLSTWDLAIEKTERLIAAKEQRFNWLLRKLISKESVNEKWQQEKLGNIAEIRMGSSPSSRAYNEDGKGLPFLQGKADLNNRLSAPRVFTSEVTQECFEGDLLLSVRAPVGYVSRSIHHGCIGRGLAALSVKKAFMPDFVFFFLLSIEHLWAKVSQGGTFDAISSTELRKISIYFPPADDRQRQIAETLNGAHQEIDLLKRQAASYRKQKRGLMQKLLAGAWNIKNLNNQQEK